MNQIEMEMMFSKKMKDFIVLDSFINDTGSLMNLLYSRIDTWREGKFYGERKLFVKNLPDTELIVIELMLTILSKFGMKNLQIQGLAVELGSRLGFNGILDAAKVGSSIIGLCAEECDNFYDIDISSDGTTVTPNMQIDSDSRTKITRLGYLPPNLVPAIWKEDSNYGGWQWEKKSVILGSGNHHNEYQSIDTLNMLQQIPWTIDTDVLVQEENPNPTFNETEILGHYIGEKFYFTWRYDKRGRMYSSGYQINPQSNEYGKAILSPVNKEVCSDEGYNALIDYRNAMRADGKDMLADKAGRAIETADYDLPVNIFVELDATNSGHQIMACLSGCVKTGTLCNLTAEPKQDSYMHVLNKLEEKVGKLGLTRKQVKVAVMTAGYNSEAKPKEIFGKHVDAFWNVMRTECPGVMDVMDIVNNCWNPYALEHSWTMPDGHVVKVKVMEPTSIKVNLDELGSTFMLDYNKNQPSTNSRSLCPNVIHSVDAFVCREMVRLCNDAGFEVSCIHDCWQCHPNNVEKLKQFYREILNYITRTNLLNNICSQIIGKDAGIKINDEGLANKILLSNHALSY